MKKKNVLKRIAALAMGAAMSLTMAFGMMGSVSAATIGEATGTLQIEKFRTGTTTGIEGVQFNYVQVGEFALTDGDVNGFTITNTVLEKCLTDAGLTAIADTTKVYDGKAIQNALVEAMKTDETKDAIKNIATTGFNATDASGKTNAVIVPVGIYLVVETSAPAEVTKLSDPFIVSVPTLLTDDNGVQSWNYNVVAQPKNDYIDTPPVPEKKVVDNEGNEITNPSAMIDETVTFEIKSTVPQMSGSLVAFDFKDTLSEGLTLGDVLTVTAKKNGQYIDIKNVEDLYTVTKNNQILTVSFDPAKVQANGYTEISVTYTATLNEKAIVGSTGTANAFEVQYTNDPEQNIDADTVTVGTYGFTLQKNDENKAALAGATFKLYDAATGENAVSFYTAIDANNNVTGNAVEEIITDEKGQASFYGLKAGTYYLEETKAPTGYNLLKSRVEITVSADTTANGADITVVNTKGFELPTTGGMGTVLFTIAGLVIMTAAVLVLFKTRKRAK